MIKRYHGNDSLEIAWTLKAAQLDDVGFQKSVPGSRHYHYSLYALAEV